MDSNLMSWWILFLLAIVLDVLLWVAGVLLDVGADGRFRLLASAVLLLLVILAMAIGWGAATAIVACGLWIYAIVLGIGDSVRTRA